MQRANGEIMECNPAAERILGLTRGKMIGRTSMDPSWRAVREDGTPFPGEEHPAMVSLRTGEPLRDVIMGVSKPDGTLTWILINSEPLAQAGAIPPGAVVASFIDITERKLARDKIQQLHAEVTKLLEARTVQLAATADELEGFAYSVSHDLRAPIRGIDGWSLALLEDYGEKLDDTGRQYLNTVREEIRHVGEHIDAMLDISRVAGRELEKEPVDLGAAAESVREALVKKHGPREVQWVIPQGLVADSWHFK